MPVPAINHAELFARSTLSPDEEALGWKTFFHPGGSAAATWLLAEGIRGLVQASEMALAGPGHAARAGAALKLLSLCR
jgi:hypothetical protein